MKTIFRISILLGIIFFAGSCSSNKKLTDSDTTIMPLSDSRTISGGSVVYGLPRTVFTVILEMERTIEKPGPYARYAGDLLGLDNVIQNENEFWSIEGISVKTHDELDPSEYYVIKSNNLFQTNILALKKEGLILDLNPEVFYDKDDLSGPRETVLDQFNSFDLGSDEYFLLQRDTAYQRVSIDSTFIRIPYIVEKKRKFSLDQLADRAARNLMEMREGRHLILTGEANVFPQSDAALKEMNRIEKDYTELFTGKILKETKRFSYQIIPETEMVGKPVTLFMFSELTGPVAGTSNGGIPVTAIFVPEQKTKRITIINNQKSGSAMPVYDKLYYRVPDVVSMKINLGTETLFHSRRLIYQFGEVIQLPANYIIGK